MNVADQVRSCGKLLFLLLNDLGRLRTSRGRSFSFHGSLRYVFMARCPAGPFSVTSVTSVVKYRRS